VTSESRYATLLMVCGLALASLLLVVRARSNYTITHDEGISYLAATGHQGRFAVEAPIPRWATGADWKRYWTPDQFWVFRRISDDLGRLDLHPPLYFWLLHVWVFVAGVNDTSGTLLNLILLAIATLVLFLAGGLAGARPLARSAAAVMWLLSGSTLNVGGEARHYALLGLAVAVNAAASLRFLSKQDVSAWAMLALSAMAGMLSHYQFSVPLSLGTLIAGALLLRAGRVPTALSLGGALIAAGVAVAVLHPGIFQSLRALRDVQPEPFSWHEASSRVATAVRSLLMLVTPARIAHRLSGPALAPILFLVGAVTAIAIAWRAWTSSRRDGGALPRTWCVLTAAVSVLVVCVLYVLQRVPRWAMAGKYLMTVSPLLYVASAVALDRLAARPRWGRWALAGLVASQAIYGVMMTREFGRSSVRARREGYVDHGAPLILDSVAQGVLPTILWHVADATPVFAASQDSLLREFPVVPSGADSLSYVSDTRYGNDLDKRARLLERFAQVGYEPTAAPGTVFAVGAWYEMVRRSSREGSPRP
jgi:Dolichyl-phosphate-mannose-protein mannosyltransferase